MPKDTILHYIWWYMCHILDYKIEKTRPASRTLVQFEQAHLRMTYTQMIGATYFVSRPYDCKWKPSEKEIQIFS